MLIGYRRVSGKIGITNNENGVRGAWVEKRKALWNNIKKKHEIIPLSKLTESTKLTGLEQSNESCDVLLLEFGGINLQFYKKDWNETIQIIKSHKGKVFFITDDPDLPFLWNLHNDYTNWTIIVNALNPKICRTILKIPATANIQIYPFHIDMDRHEYSTTHNNKVIYIGKPTGRTNYIKKLAYSHHFEIACKNTERKKIGINSIDIPQQKDRYEFYRKYVGCMALYDKKHAITGWRTGRAYHSLYSGIPVLTISGNEALNWCHNIDNTNEIDKFVNLNDVEREKIYRHQLDKVLKDREPLFL